MSTTTNTSGTSSREKKLMIVAGIMLVIIVIPMLLSFYGGSASLSRAQRNALRDEVETLETKAGSLTMYEKQLRKYMDRSLPPQGEASKDWYRKWLYNQAVKHHFQNVDATDNSSGIARGGSAKASKLGYQTYAFKLGGETSLANLSAFLGDFYKADHLHLIKSLSINSQNQSENLKITMNVETIALDSNTKKVDFADLQMKYAEDPILLAQLDTAKSHINDRKLFSIFQPPQPPNLAPPAPVENEQDFTDAMYTYVTAVIEINGVYQVWINQRLKDRTLRLFVGDKFDVGGTECIVREIHFNKVVVGAIVKDGDSVEEMPLTIRTGKSFEDCEEFNTPEEDEPPGRTATAQIAK